jgi:hypothetical protein
MVGNSGAPLAGAEVLIGSREATTDASGDSASTAWRWALIPSRFGASDTCRFDPP